MKKITTILFLILTCAQQLSAQKVGVVHAGDLRITSKVFEKYKQLHQDQFGVIIERQEFVMDSLQLVTDKGQGNDETMAGIQQAKELISYLNEEMARPIEEQPDFGVTPAYVNEVDFLLYQFVTEQNLDFIIGSHVELSNSMVIYSKPSMDLTQSVLKKINGDEISQLEVSEGLNIAFIDYNKVDFKRPEDTGFDEILITKAAENSNKMKPLNEEIFALSLKIADGNGTPEIEAKLNELETEKKLRDTEYVKLRDGQLEANKKMYNAKVERVRIAHMVKLEPAISAIIDQYQIDLILNTTDFREFELGIIYDEYYGRFINGPKFPDKSKRVLKGLEQNDITNLVLDKMNGITNDKQLIITSKKIGKVDIDAIAIALVPSDKEFKFKADSLKNAAQATYDKLVAQENYNAYQVEQRFNDQLEDLGKEIQYRIYQDIQRAAINLATELNYDILLDLVSNAKEGMFNRMDYIMFHPDHELSQRLYDMMVEKQN